MNRWLFPFVGLLLCVRITAVAQTDYISFADSLQAWVDARVANAAAGNPEQVRLPLCVRSLGWGCECPDHYIGAYPSMQEGPFVWVEPAHKLPPKDRKGHSFIVEGHFTGEWHTQDLRNADGEPEEWLYRMPVFKITRKRKNKAPESTPAPIILQGKQAPS